VKTNVTLPEAMKLVFTHTPVMEPETVPIGVSVGRVLFENLSAYDDFPVMSTAAVDGFAIKSEDVRPGEKVNIVDTTHTGEEPSVKTGGAVRISTGAFIPAWADCVVMKEYVKEENGKMVVNGEIKKGRNVNWKGQVFRKGDVVLHKGQVIDAGVLGMLCSLNLREVAVFRRPKVGIFATGGELSEPGEVGARVPNSSAHTMVAVARACGAEVAYLGIIRDDRRELARTLEEALGRFDLVASSGGVSVGEVDFMPQVAEDAGVEVLFWQVRQKPGKPVLFGVKGRAVYLGIPGYPTSAATMSEIYLKGLLRQMQGLDPFFAVEAVSASEYSRQPRERTELARCRLFFEKGILKFRMLEDQQSSNPLSFAGANSLVVLEPERKRVNVGERLKVVPKWNLQREIQLDVSGADLKKAEDLF